MCPQGFSNLPSTYYVPVMSDIPVSAETPHRKQLQIVPLGDEMPYDFRRPHRHEYFEFFVFTRGGGAHFIDFTEHTIQDHSVHIVFPGQIHLLKRTTARGSIIVCTREYMDSLSKVFYWQLLERYYAAPYLSVSEAQFSVLQGLADQLALELQQDQLLSSEMLRSYLSVFLANCIRMGKEVLAQDGESHNYPKQEFAVFQKFSALLDTHLSAGNGVAFYAAQLSMTPKALNNCIRKVTGRTCIDLIQERTLVEAKRLLLYTDKTAKEIAYELDFADNSYFTRFFAKHTGHTPSSFRTYWEKKYHS
jgi:AraC family transcriptional regulator, transcriptional activator of pobA